MGASPPHLNSLKPCKNDLFKSPGSVWKFAWALWGEWWMDSSTTKALFPWETWPKTFNSLSGQRQKKLKTACSAGPIRNFISKRCWQSCWLESVAEDSVVQGAVMFEPSMLLHEFLWSSEDASVYREAGCRNPWLRCVLVREMWSGCLY